MMRSPMGLADLIRCRAAGREVQDLLAEQLGLERRVSSGLGDSGGDFKGGAVDSLSAKQSVDSESASVGGSYGTHRPPDNPAKQQPRPEEDVATGAAKGDESPLQPTRPDTAPDSFWRLVRLQRLADSAEGIDETSADPHLPPRPRTPLAFEPLARCNELDLPLRQAADRHISSRLPDLRRLVRRLARGREVRRIPLRPMRGLSGDLSLICDLAKRLIPFREDQEFVARELRKRLPAHQWCQAALLPGGELPVVETGDDRQTGPIAGESILQRLEPRPGGTVVALTDLGVGADDGGKSRAVWRRLGDFVSACGCRGVVLFPGWASEIPAELTQVWQVIPWGRCRGEPPQEAEEDRLLDQLRIALTQAGKIEPRLLRRIRRLLPGGGGNALLESRFWMHADLECRHPHGAEWEPAAVERLRQRLGEHSLDLRRQVLEAIFQAHAGGYAGVWHLEVLNLGSEACQLEVPRSEIRAAAEWFAAGLKERRGELPSGTESRGDFLGQVHPLVSRAGRQTYPVLRRIVAEMARRAKGPMPAGGGNLSGAPTTFQLREKLAGLWFERVDVALQETGFVASDWLGKFQARDQLISVEHGDRVRTDDGVGPNRVVADAANVDWSQPVWLDVGQTIATGPARYLRVCSDVYELTLRREPKPAWAAAMGRDRFGLWCEIDVPLRARQPPLPRRSRVRPWVVTQRLRWIPPGEFMMGSLEDEPGHWVDEGPRHGVTITRGFWMFDTPCTQALWQAVMGENPSRFQDPQCPVEQVSWNDVQVFVLELAKRVAAGDWRLPTEAEWEYACRAGSETAYCFGDSEEVLGEYAWYSANSKGRPQSVGTKVPNDWGLHDLHGNVWEWCADVYDAEYYRRFAGQTAIDPVGPEAASGGSQRVYRGGGWNYYAVSCRSASRDGNSPDYRFNDLGFRLALSSVK